MLCTSRIFTASFCLLVLVLLSSGDTAIAANTELFRQAEYDASRLTLPSPETDIVKSTLRSRQVAVAFDILGTKLNPSPSFQLNLFDDTIFTAIYDRSENIQSPGFSWIGHLDDVALSQVVLVISGSTITGSVSMPGANFTIDTIGRQLHIIRERDHSAFPPELEPLSIPQTELDKKSRQIETSGDDLCTEITVLVAYTPEARVAAAVAAGAGPGSTAAIEVLIDTAVIETNQSYMNSGINQRITLVHTIETDAGDAANDFPTDLGALQNLYDGKFDNVDAGREAYYADLVALIINNIDSCGLGYLNSNASYAFTVTHYGCATGYYSFGHEIGHNLGARHDWYVDDADSYGKGFVNFDDRWRSVMAYNTRCSAYGSNCSRIQYWSNPNVSYGNPADPMGVASGTDRTCSEDSLSPDPSTCDSDNRTKLNTNCSYVANFRQAPVFADLIILPPAVSKTELNTNESYTLSASVYNQGGADSASSTLRYFLSTNATISSADAEIGTDTIAILSPSGSSSQNITLAAPGSDGTYYLGACIDTFAGEATANNNCSTAVQITVTTPGLPDMVVLSPEFDDSTPTTNQSITLAATVQNQGQAPSGLTTLRYYRSADAVITAADTLIGTDSIPGLNALATSLQNITFSAPGTAGNYYFGACVVPVSTELATYNNCSAAIQISVSDPDTPDLVVISPAVSRSLLHPGDTATFSATVQNGGSAATAATTLRYYLSHNVTITTSDLQFGSDPIPSLAVNALSSQNISAPAPSITGTYYIGACVDTISGETATTNNCSTGVEIVVAEPSFQWSLFLPAITNNHRNKR